MRPAASGVRFTVQILGSKRDLQKDIDAERTILVRISDVFLRGNLAPLLIVQSLIGDAVALWATPRAEEPRSSSPMADPTARFVVAEPLTRDLYAWPLNSRNENSLIET